MSEKIAAKLFTGWTEPKVSVLDDTHWILGDDWTAYWTENGKEYRITLLKGFVSDAASVPRPFWSIFPPTGRYMAGSFVHDELYHCQGDMSKSEWATIYEKRGELWFHFFPVWSRKQCDDLFRVFMIQAHEAPFRAWVIWQALRWCGWWAWEYGNKKMMNDEK